METGSFFFFLVLYPTNTSNQQMLSRVVQRAKPNFPTSVNPGSRLKHKEKQGEVKRRAEGQRDYMGAYNPFTMVYTSGF